MYTITNKFLTASISPDGAELKSLVNKTTGFEYIWQADPTYWNRSAPILFPIVGEVANNTLRVNGKEYTMGRHGFARDCVFTVAHQSEDEVVFMLDSSDTSTSLSVTEKYPYQFHFSVGFKLEGQSLVTTFTVANPAEETLYFSVGAHPAFTLPGGNIEDYFIEFEKTETLHRHLLANNVYSGETELVVENSRQLPLSTALFDKDAMVFKNMISKSLSIKNKKGDYSLAMDFEGFPYFGIWTKPNCHHFLCLEPWCGLADKAGYTGEFKDKEGIVVLPAGQVFERQFGITI